MTKLATHPIECEQWKESVPTSIRADPLWNFGAYQKALYLYQLCWLDCETLMRDLRGKVVAAQLIRSVGSISANIEEGYGRGFGKDYARYQVIALGSARESRGWYQRAERLLSAPLIQHRMRVLDEIIGILIESSRQQRGVKRRAG